MQEYLSPEEAAALLKLSPRTLQKWRTQKRGPNYKRVSSKIILYTRSDLDKFIDDCENGDNWKQVGDVILDQKGA